MGGFNDLPTRDQWEDWASLVTNLKDARGGVVYLLHAATTEFVKIGWTADLEARRRDLSCASPHELRTILTLRGDRALERQLHDHFEPSRIRGEWFRLDSNIGAFVTLCLLRLIASLEPTVGPIVLPRAAPTRAT